MIIWGTGKDAGVAFVYEVKPNTTPYGTVLGPEQLQRYIRGLRQLHPDRRWSAGPDLAARPFMSAAGSGRVWSDPSYRGMRFYGMDPKEKVSVTPSASASATPRAEEPSVTQPPVPLPGASPGASPSGSPSATPSFGYPGATPDAVPDQLSPGPVIPEPVIAFIGALGVAAVWGVAGIGCTFTLGLQTQCS